MKVRQAFTLIELLVVIAIIAILASLLMPALENSRSLARRVACTSNLHQMGMQIFMYQAEWDDWLPDKIDRHWWLPPANFPPSLTAYGVKPEIRNCPASPAKSVFSAGDYSYHGGGMPTSWKCTQTTDWPDFTNPMNARYYRAPLRWPLATDYSYSHPDDFSWSYPFYTNHKDGMNAVVGNGVVKWYDRKKTDTNHVYGSWPGILFPTELPLWHGNAAYHVGWPYSTVPYITATVDNVQILRVRWFEVERHCP